MKYIILSLFLSINTLFASSFGDLAFEKTNLDEQIGSLIWIGFPGKTPEEESVIQVKSLIDERKISGIVLYGHNIDSPSQLETLILFLQAPGLVISIDQEGGLVQRLRARNGFTDFPSAKEVAERSPEDAKTIYDKMAGMVHSNRINCVLGPVVDIDHDPTCSVIGGLKRAFSEDPSVVSTYAKSFIDAMEDHNILTSLKHFPGHGSASGDTHAGIVNITETWNREQELMPYLDLISSCSTKTIKPMIMTAHLVHKRLDAVYPSTLSKNILTGLLRGELGFKGGIVTDDLHMGAILNNYSFEESTILALKAGCTFLLYSNNPLAAKGVNDFQVDLMLPDKIIDLVKHRITVEQDQELLSVIEEQSLISKDVRSNLKK